MLALAAGAMSLVGDVGFAAHTANAAVFVAFFAVNATVVWLRWKRPDSPRPFRIPLSVEGTPLLPVLANLGILGLAAASEPRALLLVLGLPAVGVALAPLVVRNALKAAERSER